MVPLIDSPFCNNVQIHTKIKTTKLHKNVTFALKCVLLLCGTSSSGQLNVTMSIVPFYSSLVEF